MTGRNAALIACRPGPSDPPPGHIQARPWRCRPAAPDPVAPAARGPAAAWLASAAGQVGVGQVDRLGDVGQFADTDGDAPLGVRPPAALLVAGPDPDAEERPALVRAKDGSAERLLLWIGPTSPDRGRIAPCAGPIRPAAPAVRRTSRSDRPATRPGHEPAAGHSGPVRAAFTRFAASKAFFSPLRGVPDNPWI